MKRASIYCSEAAYTRFDGALDKVHQAIGDETPRHVAVSAPLEAAADQAGEVTRKLAKQHAEALAARLEALKQQADSTD
ncbi:hypothetical protein [Amycolatopsis sp. FDAARGOS 1241]|uniref:hypothetical protein n=1 Tax=Amycolatopsis sp. FDAARGOS 1241 TaxID=2778070 RepID=UPI00194EF32D|nr:hypothetical protein [Amycolatopsis sp. FDAARGOS 1241]QRP42989.1 hypothetical protein I6J71_26455 [Amycolatopsis sp. FDAARGOS 1241]